MYKTSDFFYNLPEELIAQTPVEPRNSSRLLKVSRETGEIKHDHFYNLCDYLKKGDLLVLNDSRVLPARLYGVKCDNNTFIEFLLLEQKGNMTWDIICRPAKKAKIGTEFSFGDGKLIAKVIATGEDGNRTVEFRCDGNFFATLDEIGQMPLPPYITEKLETLAYRDTILNGADPVLKEGEEDEETSSILYLLQVRNIRKKQLRVHKILIDIIEVCKNHIAPEYEFIQRLRLDVQFPVTFIQFQKLSDSISLPHPRSSEKETPH